MFSAGDISQVSFDKDVLPSLLKFHSDQLKAIQRAWDFSDVGSVVRGRGQSKMDTWSSYSFAAKQKGADGGYTHVIEFTFRRDEPIPDNLSITISEKKPNKTLVPMHMSVTPRAVHVSRQPYASAHL